MAVLGLSPQVKPGAGVYRPRYADNVISGGRRNGVVSRGAKPPAPGAQRMPVTVGVDAGD